MSEALLWVYGIVPEASAQLDVEGVDAAPVRLHPHAGVAALVSEVPRERFDEQALRARLEELDSLEALARAHDRVLQAAMASGAVVPFRLCTLYVSGERLDAMLERESRELTAALDRLEGMQEWGVKAFLREPAAASGTGARPATGTEYLTRKREQREADAAARDETEIAVAELHARLAERAAAATLSRPQDRRLSGRDEEMVLNAAYLVPRDGADAFRQGLEELGHAIDGVALELTGPWPPHHFVETPEA